MAEKTVTTKIWIKTHRLAKAIAGVLQHSMLQVVHDALVAYAEKKDILNYLAEMLREGERNGKNPNREGLDGDDQTFTGS